MATVCGVEAAAARDQGGGGGAARDVETPASGFRRCGGVMCEATAAPDQVGGGGDAHGQGGENSDGSSSFKLVSLFFSQFCWAKFLSAVRSIHTGHI